MISLKNVKVGHANRHCFTIESLELRPGNIYLLQGDNGSGKSSFLRMLALGQEDRAYISYPEMALLPFLSIRQNAHFILSYMCTNQREIVEFISKLEHDLQVHSLSLETKASLLSQGQALYVKFLLCLQLKVSVLALDELLGDMDEQFISRVFQLLKNKAKNSIVLLSSPKFYPGADIHLTIKEQVLFIEVLS